ncbi:MAG: nickel-dependent hydrogenase large subunit [Betaproteobacteria bacterium]
MTLEGELVVTLAWDGQRVRRTGIRSTRPHVAARVLAGRSAADAAATVPLLFSVCGGAQRAAAGCALAGAGVAGFAEGSPSRAVGVLVEALQESFWHLLIGWPDAVGGDPDVTAVAAARHLIATSIVAADGTDLLSDAAAMRELAAGLSDIAQRSLFALPPAAFAALPDVLALADWATRGETVPARILHALLGLPPSHAAGTKQLLLPPLGSDLVRQVLVPALRDDPAFARAPTWAGAPAETGALARMHTHPLVAACGRESGPAPATRLLARMVDLARSLGELAGDPPPAAAPPRAWSVALTAGEGLGVVETARGLLLHRVLLDGERVVDYQIVAPTEWNFHPDGALANSLTGAQETDETALLRRARGAVHALDPCVGWRIEVTHA